MIAGSPALRAWWAGWNQFQQLDALAEPGWPG